MQQPHDRDDMRAAVDDAVARAGALRDRALLLLEEHRALDARLAQLRSVGSEEGAVGAPRLTAADIEDVRASVTSAQTVLDGVVIAVDEDAGADLPQREARGRAGQRLQSLQDSIQASVAEGQPPPLAEARAAANAAATGEPAGPVDLDLQGDLLGCSLRAQRHFKKKLGELLESCEAAQREAAKLPPSELKARRERARRRAEADAEAAWEAEARQRHQVEQDRERQEQQQQRAHETEHEHEHERERSHPQAQAFADDAEPQRLHRSAERRYHDTGYERNPERLHGRSSGGRGGGSSGSGSGGSGSGAAGKRERGGAAHTAEEHRVRGDGAPAARSSPPSRSLFDGWGSGGSGGAAASRSSPPAPSVFSGGRGGGAAAARSSAAPARSSFFGGGGSGAGGEGGGGGARPQSAGWGQSAVPSLWPWGSSGADAGAGGRRR